jgi:sulfite dehydrogenase (quinone) subunit SoeA
MAMYHSWDSQNAWLRQIHTYNYLYVNAATGAAQAGIGTAAGCGSNRPCTARCAACAAISEAVEPGTVWTWNAIGKAAGAWGLTARPTSRKQGFLLNHLISEELPPRRR